MTMRTKGFFEKTTEQRTEASGDLNMRFTLEGIQKARVVLVALSALGLLSGVLDGTRLENQVGRWLFWIWMLTWSVAVIAIREEIVARQDWEEQQELPYLD